MSNLKIKTLLKESAGQVFTIEDIQKAIDQQTTITVAIYDAEGREGFKEVAPVEVVDTQTFYATNKDGSEEEYSLDHVMQTNAIKEAIKVKVDSLDKIDPQALDKVAEKTDVVIEEDYKGKMGLVVGEEAQVYPLGEAPSGVMVDFGEVKQVDEDENGNLTVSFEDLDEEMGNQWYSEAEYDIVRVSLDEPLFQKLYPAQKTLASGKFRTGGDTKIIYNSAGLNEADYEDENEGIAYEKEEPEFMKFITTEQKQAIYSLKSWAAELGLEISDGEETVAGIIKFGYNPSDEKYVTILISPSGDIKMSGHAVHNYDDFENLVEFFRDEVEE